VVAAVGGALYLCICAAHTDPEDGDSSHDSKVCYDVWPPPPSPPPRVRRLLFQRLSVRSHVRGDNGGGGSSDTGGGDSDGGSSSSGAWIADRNTGDASSSDGAGFSGGGDSGGNGHRTRGEAGSGGGGGGGEHQSARGLSWTREHAETQKHEDEEVAAKSATAKARLGPTSADGRSDGCIPGCLRKGAQCRDVGRAHDAYQCSFPPEQLMYAMQAQYV
jgi:hypothetical protein